MASDGKQLEGLVAFVEGKLLPQGFDVKINRRVFNDGGLQIAEFDVEIRGKVGTTNIAWLIECRDRPSSGAAPTSWIEQLVGRRTRFIFNKVTAVSTTGFAPDAKEFARLQGIEVREVRSLNPEEFSWLGIDSIRSHARVCRLESCGLNVSQDNGAQRDALHEALIASNSAVPFLRSPKTDLVRSLNDAFSMFVTEQTSYFDDVVPNGPEKQVKLSVNFKDEDQYIVDTSIGEIRIAQIEFTGGLSIREGLIPLSTTSEYRTADGDDKISQVASFEPHTIAGQTVVIEMHNIASTGETHVILRKVNPA